MKHTIRSRMLTLFLAAMMLVCTALSAQADSASSQPAAKSKTVAKLLEILDFKFFIREDGIGIRIENDLLITEGQPINLFEGLPTEIEEIEAAMQR